MSNFQSISVTAFRNNFFQYINQSYNHQLSFIVKKGNIPLVTITPASPISPSTKKSSANINLLNQLQKLRSTVKPSNKNSVQLIREMRLHNDSSNQQT